MRLFWFLSSETFEIFLAQDVVCFHRFFIGTFSSVVSHSGAMCGVDIILKILSLRLILCLMISLLPRFQCHCLGAWTFIIWGDSYFNNTKKKKMPLCPTWCFLAWILFFRVVWLFMLDFLMLALISSPAPDYHLLRVTEFWCPMKSTSSTWFLTKRESFVSCSMLMSHIFNQRIEDCTLWSTLRISQHSLLLGLTNNIRTLSCFPFSLSPGP